MTRDPSSLLPLKPIVFHILIVLNEGDRHGWALLKAVEERLGRYFDTGVYSQPAAFTFGNEPIFSPLLRAHGVRNFDLSLFKNFAVRSGVVAQFRIEALNAFNRVQFAGPNTSVTSASFGVISGQANAPRQLQFGIKLLW